MAGTNDDDPDGQWMQQVARNLTDCVDGFLLDAKFSFMTVIHFSRRRFRVFCGQATTWSSLV